MENPEWKGYYNSRKCIKWKATCICRYVAATMHIVRDATLLLGRNQSVGNLMTDAIFKPEKTKRTDARPGRRGRRSRRAERTRERRREYEIWKERERERHDGRIYRLPWRRYSKGFFFLLRTGRRIYPRAPGEKNKTHQLKSLSIATPPSIVNQQ